MGYLRERAARAGVGSSPGRGDLPYEAHWYGMEPQVAAALEPPDRGPGTTYLLHHSRFGPEDFVPRSVFLTQTDPAPVPGSMHIVLDVDGQLVSWSHRSTDEPADGASAPWDRLLELAGLPASALERADPGVVPDAFANERTAWVLASAEAENATDPVLRVEGAALNGRVVEFAIMKGPTRLGSFAWEPPRGAGGDLFFFAILVLAVLLARRNVRASRADVRGAILLGAYTTVAHVVHMFGRTLPESLGGVTRLLTTNLSYAIQTGVQVALMYLALEPFARRRWPRMLIGWNRLLEGRWRDASVGREVLLGLLGAAVFVTVKTLLVLAVAALGFDQERVASTLQPTLATAGPLPTLCHLVHHSGDTMIIGGMLTAGVARSPIRARVALARHRGLARIDDTLRLGFPGVCLRGRVADHRAHSAGSRRVPGRRRVVVRLPGPGVPPGDATPRRLVLLLRPRRPPRPRPLDRLGLASIARAGPRPRLHACADRAEVPHGRWPFRWSSPFPSRTRWSHDM